MWTADEDGRSEDWTAAELPAVTVADVHRRVETVKAFAREEIPSPDGNASAHAEEDALHRDVLRAIVAGASDPGGLAAAALLTQQVEFSRWYE